MRSPALVPRLGPVKHRESYWARRAKRYKQIKLRIFTYRSLLQGTSGSSIDRFQDHCKRFSHHSGIGTVLVLQNSNGDQVLVATGSGTPQIISTTKTALDIALLTGRGFLRSSAANCLHFYSPWSWWRTWRIRERNFSDRAPDTVRRWIPTAQVPTFGGPQLHIRWHDSKVH